MLAEFVMIVVGGLKFGAIYALAALGIVVIHKATRIVNFAHGAFVLAGAWATYGIVEGLNLGYWPAYVLVPIASGPQGDLYLSIRVEDDPVFERRGPDVFAVLDVPMTRAALGGEVEIETLDGPERVEIEPGTQSGTMLRLRGKGIPNLGRRGRGDLFLTIAVETPRDLSKDQRKLVEELARLRGEPAGKRSSSTGSLRHPRSQAR